MIDNHTRESWYITHRKEVISRFKNGKKVPDKREVINSPSDKYKLEINRVSFKKRKREYVFSYVNVFGKDKIISRIHRNDSDFPHLFVETESGDYLIYAEDVQSRTILDLNTGKYINYISEKASRELEFRWKKMVMSPNNKYLMVEGLVKHKPKDVMDYREIRFYDVKNLNKLPYKEVGERITFPFDSFISWEGDDKYVFSIREEYSKEKDMPIRDMSKEERSECLAKEGDHSIKKIFYRMSLLEELNREEVFYEWIK